MSTILQPCLESQFIETATVKLKVAPSSSDLCEGLSFQQILAGIGSGGEKESVYVHPLSKQSSSSYSSSSRLSEKSFEMCTENLGSETGTDDVMDMSSIFSSSTPSPSPSPREYSSSRSLSSKKKNYKVHSFPPPLTSISGANSLQVRSHRENGRLVLEAIETHSAPHTYLQAERSNGRLRLTLYNHKEEEKQEQEDEDEEEEEEEENESSYINDQDLEEIEEEDDDDDDDESDAEIMMCNNNDDNVYDHELHEMGMEKYKRTSRRCNININEGHGGHSNTYTPLYKPLWVATS